MLYTLVSLGKTKWVILSTVSHPSRLLIFLTLSPVVNTKGACSDL